MQDGKLYWFAHIKLRFKWRLQWHVPHGRVIPECKQAFLARSSTTSPLVIGYVKQPGQQANSILQAACVSASGLYLSSRSSPVAPLQGRLLGVTAFHTAGSAAADFYAPQKPLARCKVPHTSNATEASHKHGKGAEEHLQSNLGTLAASDVTLYDVGGGLNPKT